MLVSSIDIHEQRRTLLLIVIEKENFERMKNADPITLESVNEGGWLPIPTYPANFSILIAYEENDEELYKRAKSGGAAFLAYLERNRKWKPEVDGVQHIMKIPKAGR